MRLRLAARTELRSRKMWKLLTFKKRRLRFGTQIFPTENFALPAFRSLNKIMFYCSTVALECGRKARAYLVLSFLLKSTFGEIRARRRIALRLYFPHRPPLPMLAKGKGSLCLCYHKPICLSTPSLFFPFFLASRSRSESA